ncbi:MAG TPA: DUF2085 domain-containing protein [Thermoanaerobaculia bacterium]|jgi:uncharacterized membrane protein|nr:DUF2085 domain-containing protein [Thermoanaerobaculia bacterium]
MTRDTKIAGSVFAGIPLFMLGTSTLCTWLIAQGAPRWLRLAFRVACHGIESRCLWLWGVPMPICARCVALYASFFAGLLAFTVLPAIEERLLRIAAWMAVTPLAIDGVTQALRLRESTNGLRIATGSIAGFAFGLWILSAIEQRAASRSARLDAL